MSAVEIHRELCRAVYCQNVITGGTVRKWRRMFKDGRINVHDEERSGGTSEMSDDLVQSVDQIICERWRFTISELSCEFPQPPRDYHSQARLSQVLHRMGSENAHGCAQNEENDFGFDFLKRYHKDGYEFRNHFVRVTDNETWISFVNVETIEQSK
jgi:hypothetical protein